MTMLRSLSPHKKIIVCNSALTHVVSRELQYLAGKDWGRRHPPYGYEKALMSAGLKVFGVVLWVRSSHSPVGHPSPMLCKKAQ